MFDLYDDYCHGRIDRRDFLLRAGALTVGGVSALTMAQALLPRYAEAQTISFTDPRIKGKYVTYPSPGGNSGTMRGYLVQPSGAGPFPVVLVIHENRGLNPYIEDVARRAATEGFLALAPDGLFPVGGYPGNDDDGRTLQAGLDQDKLRTDMVNSARFAKTHALSTGKLGVTGFCWGGSTTNFLAVTLGPDLQAGVPFYGGGPRDGARGEHQGAAADPVRGDRRARECHVAGLRERAEGRQRPVPGVHLSRHPARLSQQLDAALPGGGGQAGLGADDRVLQEAPGLRISATESASSTPMAMLKILSRRRSCRTRWAVAPNASQTKPLGSAASTKRPPSQAA